MLLRTRGLIPSFHSQQEYLFHVMRALLSSSVPHSETLILRVGLKVFSYIGRECFQVNAITRLFLELFA